MPYLSCRQLCRPELSLYDMSCSIHGARAFKAALEYANAGETVHEGRVEDVPCPETQGDGEDESGSDHECETRNAEKGE